MYLHLGVIMSDFSEMLSEAVEGDVRSGEALLPLVYEELHRMARARMAGISGNHTLQPTALVHEAWLKMVGDEDRTWQNHAHFLAVASTAMRHVLVGHARKKMRLKRGGDRVRADVELSDLAEPAADEKILMVEEALVRLEQVHPDWAQVVVMKFFGGMLNKEVAESLEMGERSVERYWAAARAWLFKAMSGQG